MKELGSERALYESQIYLNTVERPSIMPYQIKPFWTILNHFGLTLDYSKPPPNHSERFTSPCATSTN